MADFIFVYMFINEPSDSAAMPYGATHVAVGQIKLKFSSWLIFPECCHNFLDTMFPHFSCSLCITIRLIFNIIIQSESPLILRHLRPSLYLSSLSLPPSSSVRNVYTPFSTFLVLMNTLLYLNYSPSLLFPLFLLCLKGKNINK